MFLWGLSPQTPGIYRLDANPSESLLPLGLSFNRTPAWSWPRSRRSACFPAEAYPPLRPLVVYPQQQFCATVERKKSLIISALSGMGHNGSYLRSPLPSSSGTDIGRRSLPTTPLLGKPHRPPIPLSACPTFFDDFDFTRVLSFAWCS